MIDKVKIGQKVWIYQLRIGFPTKIKQVKIFDISHEDDGSFFVYVKDEGDYHQSEVYLTKKEARIGYYENRVEQYKKFIESHEKDLAKFKEELDKYTKKLAKLI